MSKRWDGVSGPGLLDCFTVFFHPDYCCGYREVVVKKFLARFKFSFLLDILEIHLPSLLFFTLFVFYVIMIAYRYIFLKQINGIYELSVVIFLWFSLFSSTYGARSGEHIMFSILYDKLPEKYQLIFRIIGSLLIVVVFSMLIPSAYKSVLFGSKRGTSILKIPYSYVKLPILSFLGLTVLHYTVYLIRDIKKILILRTSMQR